MRIEMIKNVANTLCWHEMWREKTPLYKQYYSESRQEIKNVHKSGNLKNI